MLGFIKGQSVELSDSRVYNLLLTCALFAWILNTLQLFLLWNLYYSNGKCPTKIFEVLACFKTNVTFSDYSSTLFCKWLPTDVNKLLLPFLRIGLKFYKLFSIFLFI